MPWLKRLLVFPVRVTLHFVRRLERAFEAKERNENDNFSSPSNDRDVSTLVVPSYATNRVEGEPEIINLEVRE